MSIRLTPLIAASLAAFLIAAGPLAAGEAKKAEIPRTIPPTNPPTEKKVPPLLPGKTPGQRALARPIDFGPLEDGSDQKSHEDVERLGWTYLFDSRIPGNLNHIWNSLGAWRARNPKLQDHWKVTSEGTEWVLENDLSGGKPGEQVHGTDLISLPEFWDLDLHVEFRYPAGSNSGVYLRGRYEIQIADTPADKKDLGPGDLGGIYTVAAASTNAGKGPGKWQTLEVQLRGFRLTVRLNGQLIHENVEIPPERRKGTGSELHTGDGVYSDEPDSPGPIFLQGDHGAVAFKNIRVRPVRSYGAIFGGPRKAEKVGPIPVPGGKAEKKAAE